jgi:hypothetical protein
MQSTAQRVRRGAARQIVEGLLRIPLPRPTEYFGRVRGYRKRARAVAPTAQTVVWTLRSFPKEFNHPPAPLGPGQYLINDAGSCWARLFSVSARSPRFWRNWASAAQKVPCTVLSPRRLLSHGSPVWKEAVASAWASLQPPMLGVGRYGESVPLLLSLSVDAPTPGPFLPHQPEGKRRSARSDPHPFRRARSERSRPSLITRPTLVDHGTDEQP